MTARYKNIIIREGLLLLGFMTLFLAGWLRGDSASSPAFAEILILAGLYGYPVFAIIRYTLRTARVFKNLDGAGQRRRTTVILLSVVGLYLLFFIYSYVRKEYAAHQGSEKVRVAGNGKDGDFFIEPQAPSSTECTITARILSVKEKYYDDLTVLRRKHHRRGVTKVFLQLQILGVEGPVRGQAGSDASTRMCQAGQIVDAYAYKETDRVGTQPLRKFDKIKCEIVALPLASEGFYYKITRIRRH